MRKWNVPGTQAKNSDLVLNARVHWLHLPQVVHRVFLFRFQCVFAAAVFYFHIAMSKESADFLYAQLFPTSGYSSKSLLSETRQQHKHNEVRNHTVGPVKLIK